MAVMSREILSPVADLWSFRELERAIAPRTTTATSCGRYRTHTRPGPGRSAVFTRSPWTRSPKFDGGIATRLDTVPVGIVLNRDGVRFHDEGEDLWPKCYAMWGRHIAQQPGQIAYAFWDAKVDGLFLPPMYGSYTSDNIGDLTRPASG